MIASPDGGGAGSGGLYSGVGLVAVPSLLKDVGKTGVTSEIAIANVVPKPGFTDFAIFIYDQNGLLDYVCQKLNEKQVEYIDLNSWGYVNNGFKGSAIISAVFWEHDVFDDDGFFLRNLVGLGAVAVERSRTRLEQDVAGDEAAGARGIPFKQSDIEDEEFEFRFMGPAAPLCPGVPENLRQKPGEGPTCLGPVWDEEVSADWSTVSNPVPLWYSAGVCSVGGIASTYALENPDVAWDGTDGQILTFINCSSGAEEITFTAPACAGPTPGQLITFYQAPGGEPDPWQPASPCANAVACQNPNIVGWCGTTSYGGSGCNYTLEPGEFQVFVHCDYYAQSCPPFSFNYTFSLR